MDVLEKIKDIVAVLDDLDDRLESLPSLLSEVDKRISDIYHYIETNTMNSKNSYRVVKELKAVLSERRQLKVELSVLSTFKNNKDRLNLKSNRQMLLKNVCKEQKVVTQDYNYRVYNEEEFKAKMEN